MAISKEKQKSVANVLSKINKKFGAGSVSFAKDKVEDLTVKYILTPSHVFNAMIGGGFGCGRITELYGENSSGKTTLAIETIAYNQKMNPDFIAGWFETEGSIDRDTLETFGVDMERLIYWDQTDAGAEQGLDILRGLVASGEFNMIVVNSVAALCPTKEIEDEMDKQQVALTARIMSKLMRVLTGVAHKTGTNVLFINQTRTNVGQLYGDPTVTSGGKSLAFYASQRVAMRRAKINAGEPIKAEEGVKIACRVVKNRLCKKNPYTTCEYYAIYGKGIDSISELPGILVDAGILRRAGAYLYWERNGDLLTVGGVECKFKSKTALVEAIKENEVLHQALVKALNESLTKGQVKTESLSEEEIAEIKQQEEQILKEGEAYGFEADEMEDVLC